MIQLLEALMDKERVHDVVKAGYAAVARRSGGCCEPAPEQSTGCCGPAVSDTHAETATLIGYAEEDVTGAAADANLGLGCGNPTALASLKPGETVVDLGSGAGFDALLSAERLGPEGRFIGVDMTPEMLERARTNAVSAGHARTVEFREGLIENLPVASDSVDVVISNCVINLSPDKAQVFREAHRVLKPGGRLAVSDIVLSEPLPEEVVRMAASWIACVGGASTEEEYLSARSRLREHPIHPQACCSHPDAKPARPDVASGRRAHRRGTNRGAFGHRVQLLDHCRKAMSSVVEDVIAFCRMFSSFEREEICCGTVSAAQCVLLQTLTAGEWDVSSLATQSRVTKGAMTRLVDGLEKRGWVVRERGENDGRRVLVSLTGDGKKEAKRLNRLTERSITTLFERIPEEQRDQVVRSIQLLRKAAEETRAQIDCC
jgi:DNA-binding MarR family transcriptional regulator/SAM-dependent methyltransferase